MPVILDDESAFATWLSTQFSGRGQLEQLFLPYDAGLMDAQPSVPAAEDANGP
jgi:hypothetical protein